MQFIQLEAFAAPRTRRRFERHVEADLVPESSRQPTFALQFANQIANREHSGRPEGRPFFVQVMQWTTTFYASVIRPSGRRLRSEITTSWSKTDMVTMAKDGCCQEDLEGL